MPTQKTGLLAAGNWIVDTTKTIDVYPAQDTLANILTEERNNGGGAFNVLMDLSRLGVKFPLRGLGLVGADSEGEWIHAECSLHGIDSHLVQAHPTAATSYTDVMSVESTGRRTFFHQRGANAFLGPEHFQWDEMEARIFYLGYLLLLDTLDRPDADFGVVAGRVLHEAGRRDFYRVVDLVSDESADYARIHPALAQVDLLICNEIEAERVTGIPIRRADGTPEPGAIDHAAKRLLEIGVRDWVLIHMPEGAVAHSRTQSAKKQGSLQLDRGAIKGAAGAGDAFAAGVLLGLHETFPMQECLQIGVCAAAACLGDRTTSRGVLPLAECLKLGEQCGYRSFEF